MYASVFTLATACWLELPVLVRPASYSTPSSKVNTYLAGRKMYNMLFVGDSRTYTDIQPRVTDLVTMRKSYNLASFGLWMPVQYLEFRDVFPKVPQGTVIVWSLSHHNFNPVGERWWIPGQYAFGLFDFVQYAFDGYPLRRILREYEEAPYSPADLVVGLRKKLLPSPQTVMWRTPWLHRGVMAAASAPGGERAAVPRPSVPSAAELNRTAAEQIMRRLKEDHQVISITPVMQDGIINSVETTRSDGGYDRIIVDRAFFKQQQSKLWPPHPGGDIVCSVVANDVYMKTFTRILDLISKYRLRVIVNYIEDAPGSWPSEADRRCARQFIVRSIEQMLRRRGIAFIAPDFYPLIHESNDFYFDNSHLISEGAAKYSKALAIEIKQTLEQKGW